MKSILNFLVDISAHNTREHLQEIKPMYEKAKDLFEEKVSQCLQTLSEFDPLLQDQDTKSCIFRLARDTRFSKNKDPYKSHFGAYMCKGGRNSPYAGYYLHIEPGKSFIAAGTYQPLKEDLDAIRKEIDYTGDRFKELLSNPELTEAFEELYQDRLKTIPRGYPKEHPHAELLTYKSFILTHKYSDDEICSPDFLSDAFQRWKKAYHVLFYLNEAMGHFDPEHS